MTTSQPFERRPANAGTRFALQVQVFLLRRNWMGPAGKFLMVITTTGRKSGKAHSLPIGYLRDADGKTIIAYTLGGESNWFKNLRTNPAVTLNILTKSAPYRAELVDMADDAEVLRILEQYKAVAGPNILERFFGVSATASGAELLKARERIALTKFHPAS